MPVIEENDSVVGHAPYIYGQGLLSLNSSVTGGLIRGISPEHEASVSALTDHMVDGSFDSLERGEYNIILGEGLAYTLGAYPGDKVTLISPQGQSTPAGLMPRLRRFTVVGTFDLGMDEYDSSLALVHIDDAAKLYKAGSQVSGVRIKLDDINASRLVNRELTEAFTYRYLVSDWTMQHENFFRALEIERRVMFIILFLIVAVAAFNIVSTLVMVVTDKRADIAILRTIGLSPTKVMGIFFVQGVTSGLIGTIVGGILGVVISFKISTIVPFIEGLLGFSLFPGDVYIISNFSAEVRVSDVATIMLSSILLCVLATIYPSWLASKTHPAQALRYE